MEAKPAAAIEMTIQHGSGRGKGNQKHTKASRQRHRIHATAKQHASRRQAQTRPSPVGPVGRTAEPREPAMYHRLSSSWIKPELRQPHCTPCAAPPRAAGDREGARLHSSSRSSPMIATSAAGACRACSTADSAQSRAHPIPQRRAAQSQRSASFVICGRCDGFVLLRGCCFASLHAKTHTG